MIGVDDDHRVRESLRSLLESAGYSAQVFSSAGELLASDALAGAACVIADVRMPWIGGIELLERIKRDRPGLPVIIVSAFDDDETRRQALDGGAAGFMAKPFDAGALLELVGMVVG